MFGIDFGAEDADAKDAKLDKEINKVLDPFLDTFVIRSGKDARENGKEKMLGATILAEKMLIGGIGMAILMGARSDEAAHADFDKFLAGFTKQISKKFVQTTKEFNEYKKRRGKDV